MQISAVFRRLSQDSRSRDSRRVRGTIFALAIFLASSGPASAAPDAYLTFQLFTDAKPALWDAPNVFAGVEPASMTFVVASKQEIVRSVRDIVAKIGMTGLPSTKLGFMVGPIALEYTDAQIRTLIRTAFEVAQEEQVAVGFHLDDSMFWYRRRDLWSDSRNVEWLDWARTPNTGRRIDWTTGGTRLAPQMCYNARAIVDEVTRVSRDVIGAEVRAGVAALAVAGRLELFAGVIVGWETQLGRDFATNRALGFCALSNKGFSAANPPVDIDAAREQIVREFIELWSAGLAAAGVDTRKVYSHTAFVPPVQHTSTTESFSARNNFAPARVAFGTNHSPGFSTYASLGSFDHLYDELRLHPGGSGWASAEGTNIRIGSTAGQETMETYLARHFNHGATLVNLFSWGIGASDDPFRLATENAQAIAAYRKFLSGQALVKTVVDGLPEKMQRMVVRMPLWLQAGGDPSQVQPLLETMWAYLRANQPVEAEATIDRVLALIE